MKITALLILATLTLTGCANSRAINGKVYEPYGLANADRKAEGIQYEIPTANFVVGLLFSESLIVPGYIVLFDLYEPVGGKEVLSQGVTK